MDDALLPEDVLSAVAPDVGAARAERQARALEELAEIGMEMARALKARVLACEDDAAVSELVLAFARVSRAVRLTIALEARLADAQALRAETLAARAAEARAAVARAREERLEQTAGQVQDAVEMAIAAQTAERDDGGYESERLSEALSEHLEDRREIESFAETPVSLSVAKVCRALGVAVDWDLWRNEDWAIEEWRAATPGSPYAESTDGARPPPAHGPPARRPN
jgi:hypothetical protein